MGTHRTRIRITWIIAALLIAIVISNLIAAYNVIKLFVLNRDQTNVAITTVSDYSTDETVWTYSYQADVSTKKMSETDTTYKHRRRYKYDKKTGKYVRVRKPKMNGYGANTKSSLQKTIAPMKADSRTQEGRNNVTNEKPSSNSEQSKWSSPTETNKANYIRPAVSADVSTSIQLNDFDNALSLDEVTRTSKKTQYYTQTSTFPTASSYSLPRNLILRYQSLLEPSDKRATSLTNTESPLSSKTVMPTETYRSSSISYPQLVLPTSKTSEVTDFDERILSEGQLKRNNVIESVTIPDNGSETFDAAGTKSELTSSETEEGDGSEEFEVNSEKGYDTRTSPTIPNIKIPSTTVLTTATVMYSSRYFQRSTNFNSPATYAPPRYSGFTLVTALLDIGRGNWWEYRRPLEKYYLYLDNVLRLKVNLIIFVDQKSANHVYQSRKRYRMGHMTTVVPLSLDELPLYRYIHMMRDIMSREQSGENWDPYWDKVMSTHPEAKSAEYDILVNSKPYLLYNASVTNPFASEYFAWLDAGYAHGNRSVFPYNYEWYPQLASQKISLIKVTPSYDSIFRYTIKDLYRKNWAVISGGFIGGDIYSLHRFYLFYFRTIVDMIYRRLIDDDQTTLVILIQQQPALFDIKHGDWFDAFRLF